MTIRELLETWGGLDRFDVAPAITELLDEFDAAPRAVSTAGTGDLQITCGGKVLFELARSGKLRLYLVFDDERGERWEFEARQIGDPTVTVARHGPKPSPRLRLVVSA